MRYSYLVLFFKMEVVMIEIVLTACSIVQGATCKEISLTFMEPEAALSVYACAHNGQLAVAQWSEGHPNWRVVKFTCGRPRTITKT